MSKIPKWVEAIKNAGLKYDFAYPGTRQELQFDAPDRGQFLVIAWGIQQGIKNLKPALRRLGFKVIVMDRHNKGWKEDCAEFIEREKPRFALTCQKFYKRHGDHLHQVAREAGTRLLFIDYGFWPHYSSVWWDREGMNASSCIVGHLDRELAATPREILAEARHKIDTTVRPTLETWAEAAENDKNRLGLEGIPEDFTLLALQRTGDMALRADAGKRRQDMGQVLRIALKEAKHHGIFLVAKTHPLEKQLELKDDEIEGPHWRVMCNERWERASREHNFDRMGIPHSQARDNDMVLAWLIKHCGHFVTINSTTGLLAMVMGKPVSYMGRGWHRHNGIAAEVYGMHNAFERPAVNQERVDLFLDLLMSRQLTLKECGDENAVAQMIDVLYPGAIEQEG